MVLEVKDHKRLSVARLWWRALGEGIGCYEASANCVPDADWNANVWNFAESIRVETFR